MVSFAGTGGFPHFDSQHLEFEGVPILDHRETQSHSAAVLCQGYVPGAMSSPNRDASHDHPPPQTPALPSGPDQSAEDPPEEAPSVPTHDPVGGNEPDGSGASTHAPQDTERMTFATQLGNVARTVWESLLNPSQSGREGSQESVPQTQARSNQEPQPTSTGPTPQFGRATLEPELPPGLQPTVLEGGVPSIVYYTLPFSALDGRQALLAIPGNFLPLMQVPSPEHSTPQSTQDPQSTDGPAQTGQRVRVNVLAPASPIFVPLGASVLPFSWLYDPNGWGWPIISLQDGNLPSGLPMPRDPRNAHFLAGPPFPIRITMSTGPDGLQAEEQPNPERAKTFVDSLETADAELRARMARLGIGDIGSIGGEDGELGCPVCLDPYDESADRPEWVGGDEARDHHVVVIPCNGFHSLHRRCLLDWLATKPPSRWTCPMCRSSITPSDLLKDQPHRTGAPAAGQPLSSVHPPSDESLQKELAARSQSLREEIHRREKAQGYLCDYLACFPDYEQSQADATDDLDRRIVTLKPCGHRLHVECLTTSLRILNGFNDKGTLVDDEQGSDDEDEDEDDRERVKLVGKWVECPVDRKEVWAKIPVLKKRFRNAQHAADRVPAANPVTMPGRTESGATGTNISAESNILCGQVHRLSTSPECSHDHGASTQARQAKRHFPDVAGARDDVGSNISEGDGGSGGSTPLLTLSALRSRTSGADADADADPSSVD